MVTCIPAKKEYFNSKEQHFCLALHPCKYPVAYQILSSKLLLKVTFFLCLWHEGLIFQFSLIGIKGWMVKGLLWYCLSQTSSLMCHNSLSEPCPHLVRWLMGISIIGIPIVTLLTSLSCISPLLTSYPKIPPGLNKSVWHKCQTQSGSGVNTHKYGTHMER